MFPSHDHEEITIYRGIKSNYDPEREKTGYSCWTTSYDQAERFATYHFTGGKQFTPIYAKEGTILVSETTFDEIAVFTGSSEKEVIMRNPVEVTDVITIDPSNKEQKGS